MSSFATSETVQLDINQLSSFTSDHAMPLHDNVMYAEQQPTTLIGKLFRIISTTFGTSSNVSVYNNTADTV
jgi:hypothetical protein